MKTSKLTARDIEKFLREKHAADVFVAQCKTGESGPGVQIFDGWAMKPSWANPLVYGYEIKISRSDFLRDDKWRGYLPYCNEFYFVCPSGLIDPSEIPEGVGLMHVAGSRLLIKKRASYHEALKLETLYKYILMYHAKLIQQSTYGQGQEQNREYRINEWKDRLRQAKDLSDLGGYLSRSIQNRIRTEFISVKNENRKLTGEIEKLQEVREVIEKLGIKLSEIHSWNIESSIKNRLSELESGLPLDFVSSLKSVKQIADLIIAQVEK